LEIFAKTRRKNAASSMYILPRKAATDYVGVNDFQSVPLPPEISLVGSAEIFRRNPRWDRPMANRSAKVPSMEPFQGSRDICP
jgi:hypothetical protein